jgi:hypothetical protein
MLPHRETALLLRLAKGPVRPAQTETESLWHLVQRGLASAVRGERSVYAITATGRDYLAVSSPMTWPWIEQGDGRGVADERGGDR